MTTRVKNAGNPVVVPTVDETNLETSVESQFENAVFDDTENDGFSWDSIMAEVDAQKTRDDIIRECLADTKHFRRINNLRVKNVKAFAYLAKDTNRITTRITFVIDKVIPGMVVDDKQLDAFGLPTRRLGVSRNVFSSAYAIAGAMKETAKGAIFADEVSGMTAILAGANEREITGTDNIANTLYAGGEVDVICQFVPANTPYVNPFSSKNDDNEPTVFDEDRIFHHVIRLQFGETGNDKYRARILS